METNAHFGGDIDYNLAANGSLLAHTGNRAIIKKFLTNAADYKARLVCFVWEKIKKMSQPSFLEWMRRAIRAILRDEHFFPFDVIECCRFNKSSEAIPANGFHGPGGR